MAKPTVLLQGNYTNVVAGEVQQCCAWKLTEPIGAVQTGDVGYTPTGSELRCDVVEELKRRAVAAINALQSTYVLDESDCVAWEIG